MRNGGRPDGSLFDPWLRVHEQAGAESLGVAPASMQVTGTVAEWKGWTDMAFPGSGRYVVPGALVPVEIDLELNEGVYVEPNFWMSHSCAADRSPKRRIGRVADATCHGRSGGQTYPIGFTLTVAVAVGCSGVLGAGSLTAPAGSATDARLATPQAPSLQSTRAAIVDTATASAATDRRRHRLPAPRSRPASRRPALVAPAVAPVVAPCPPPPPPPCGCGGKLLCPDQPVAIICPPPCPPAL